MQLICNLGTRKDWGAGSRIEFTGLLSFKEIEYLNMPIIPKESIKPKYDKNGNLIITWEVPFELYELDPTLKTKVDIRLWFFDGEEKIGAYSCKIPSYMNNIFIPKNIIEELMAKGYRYEIEAIVRASDNRSTSGAQKLKLIKIKN